MFPAGAVGVALLILRISVVTLFLLLISGVGYNRYSWWELLLVAVVTLSLCLGLYTPIFCIISALVELTGIATAKGCNTPLVFVFVLFAIATAILGPGAFSIDARLFGRRLIVLITHSA